jgi:hypothetical protein
MHKRAQGYPCNVFLTQVVDPAGNNTTTLTYDSKLRLT